MHVGTLTYRDGVYRFCYSPEFKDRDDLAPISAFRELNREYVSERLWPFFAVRIPPLERADVRSLLARRGLRQDDTLEILAAIGRGRNIASPYEFRLFESDGTTRSIGSVPATI